MCILALALALTYPDHCPASCQTNNGINNGSHTHSHTTWNLPLFTIRYAFPTFWYEFRMSTSAEKSGLCRRSNTGWIAA